LIKNISNRGFLPIKGAFLNPASSKKRTAADLNINFLDSLKKPSYNQVVSISGVTKKDVTHGQG
jgi:hypothetical protein